MAEYLYEMERLDGNGEKVILRTNSKEEYDTWLQELKESKPIMKQESKSRILLMD